MNAQRVFAAGGDTTCQYIALHRKEPNILRRSAIGNTRMLGSFEGPLRQMHQAFLEETSHTTKGATRHFKDNVEKWHTVIVALDGKNIVGYAALSQNDKDNHEFAETYVLPEYRERGILKTFLAMSEEISRDLKAQYLQICIVGEGLYKPYVEHLGYHHYSGGYPFHRKEL